MDRSLLSPGLATQTFYFCGKNQKATSNLRSTLQISARHLTYTQSAKTRHTAKPIIHSTEKTFLPKKQEHQAVSERLLKNHLVFHISPGTSQNLLTLHSLHQIYSIIFNKYLLDINKYLCASTLPSLVSGTLCEDFGIKELITFLWISFQMDSMYIIWWKIMSTGTNLSSFWGRILQVGFQLTIRKTRNECCILLSRVESLGMKEGWPCPGKHVSQLSSLQAWKYPLSISFVIKCLPKSHYTLPYNFFSTYFKCTCNWVPIQ